MKTPGAANKADEDNHRRRAAADRERRACRVVAVAEAFRPRRLVPARLAVIGLVLCPVAARAGRRRKAAERNMSVGLDIERELLPAQWKRRPVTRRRRTHPKPDRRWERLAAGEAEAPQGRSIGLDLTPQQYLEMLTEEYQEYQEHWQANRYRASMRKAITCCALSNAMPEIIFAQYSVTKPEKVHNAENRNAYRAYLRTQCEAHHTVRDICDYSKHGTQLTWRQSGPNKVTVEDAKHITRQEGFFRGLLLLTETREVERLMVRHLDGRTQLMDEILEQVIASWKAIFEQDRL
jgi:hypothetical protein